MKVRQRLNLINHITCIRCISYESCLYIAIETVPAFQRSCVFLGNINKLKHFELGFDREIRAAVEEWNSRKSGNLQWIWFWWKQPLAVQPEVIILRRYSVKTETFSFIWWTSKQRTWPCQQLLRVSSHRTSFYIKVQSPLGFYSHQFVAAWAQSLNGENCLFLSLSAKPCRIEPLLLFPMMPMNSFSLI